MPPKAPADRPPTSRLPKFEPPDHRACNSLTPSAALTPSIPVHRWIRAYYPGAATARRPHEDGQTIAPPTDTMYQISIQYTGRRFLASRANRDLMALMSKRSRPRNLEVSEGRSPMPCTEGASEPVDTVQRHHYHCSHHAWYIVFGHRVGVKRRGAAWRKQTYHFFPLLSYHD